MPTPGALGWPKPSKSVSYLVAFLTVAAAVVAARFLSDVLDTNPVVSLFLCGIMFVAWFGGVGPAWFATGLSILAFDYYFVPPTDSFALAAKDIPRVVLFSLAASFVVMLSAAQRSASDALWRAHDGLQLAVQELEQANTALQTEGTERKRAEQEVRRAEEELQATIDTIPVLVASYSPDGTRYFVNRTWQSYTGIAPEDVIGEDWSITVHPDDFEAGERKWRASMETGKPFLMELRFRRADGEYRWHSVKRVPLHDPQGRIVRWYSVSHDIEDQRRAETALRRSEAYLAEAQRLSQTGSFGWRVVDGHLNWSKETYRIVELDQTIKPTMELILERVHPDDRAIVQHHIERAKQGEKDHEYEHRLLMPNGESKIVHVRARNVRFESGEEEIVGAVMDITGARRVHEALLETQAELAHITRVTTLGQLTASIAHEVSQPLAGIVTNGEAGLRWLERETPDVGEARRAIKRIISDAERASDVIRRIRDHAKKMTPEMARLDINEVIEDVRVMVRRQALSDRASLRMELAAGLPEVVGDRVQLQQVLINLVINGIEAVSSISDRPRELFIRSQPHQEDEVLVAVRDAGVGFNPAVANRLFNPFFTTKPDGMGMGLSICRSIVEAHGGRIWAVNNDGPGATISFTVPRFRSEDQLHPPQARTAAHVADT